MCGKLVKSMNGTRDAARNWDIEYTGFMKELGLQQGFASACAIYRTEKR